MLTTFLAPSEGEKRRSGSPSASILHLDTRTNDRVSGEFPVVMGYEINPSKDKVDGYLNCACLQRASGDECNHTVTPNILPDDNIDIRKCHGVVTFSFIRSVHHIVRSNY